MCYNNNDLIKISDLPQIDGFSWWQLIELWPKQHNLVNDTSQYDSVYFTNIKIYISSLNLCVREKIQEIFNNITNKYDICPSEEDTIYHCVKIINSIIKKSCLENY